VCQQRAFARKEADSVGYSSASATTPLSPYEVGITLALGAIEMRKAFYPILAKWKFVSITFLLSIRDANNSSCVALTAVKGVVGRCGRLHTSMNVYRVE
jgi:hypothetical protein